jgi:uncharacterized protein (DUF1697 family)
MARHAAFLRAVNLGRQRKASSQVLREAFEAEGFEDVATFRTSGNVVFDGPSRDLTARIEHALQRALGFEVPVFLRTAKEVQAIAASDPFDESLQGKLQVALLLEKPRAAARKQVLALATAEDQLAFGDRELYWLPSGGTQQSKLDRAAIDDLLGPTTMRTKGTIEQMAAKFFEGER